MWHVSNTVRISTPPLPDADVGRSWLPVLEGKPVEWRSHVFGETEHSAAVSDGRFKAIFYPSAAPRMFDLNMDPLEMRNLADTPAHQDRLKGLADRLRRYVRERAIYSKLGEDAPGTDRSGQSRKERLRRARDWYESIIAGEGLAV